VINTLQQLWN